MSEIFNFPYGRYFLVAYLSLFVLLIVIKIAIKKVKVNKDNTLLALGVITLGISVGLIMGNNRNPISDTVVSSILSIIGGLLAYLFYKNEKTDNGETPISQRSFNANRLTVILFLILFPLALLYGANSGALLRIKNEVDERAVEFNHKLSLDSLELLKKQSEFNLELNKIKALTWSENEKKRYEFILNHLQSGDTIPFSPVY